MMLKKHAWQIELELRHIALEVNAERYRYLESFFESYYCYQQGLLTKNGLPDVIEILSHAARSEAAKKTVKRTECAWILLCPLSVIKGILTALARDELATLIAIEQCLDRYLNYFVITKSEYRQLQTLGLMDRLPASCYTAVSPDYRLGILERLSSAGIVYGAEVSEWIDHMIGGSPITR